jgi:hypothetical protein
LTTRITLTRAALLSLMVGSDTGRVPRTVPGMAVIKVPTLT